MNPDPSHTKFHPFRPAAAPSQRRILWILDVARQWTLAGRRVFAWLRLRMFPTSETHHLPAVALLAGSAITTAGALGYLFTVHPNSATFSQQWTFGFTLALIALAQGGASALLAWPRAEVRKPAPITILIDTPKPRPGGGVRPAAFAGPGPVPFFVLPTSRGTATDTSASREISRVASGS